MGHSSSGTISIHAPAKGATIPRCNHLCYPQNFNPRSREGSDMIDDIILTNLSTFQSTLPRRERHGTCERYGVWTEISIHAPAKGATAILAKIQLKISAKINNFFFFYTIFPLYNLLLIHKIHFICIFFWCESPGIFMSAPDSHPTSAAFKHFCHNINVSSTAIPLSTPMCSTFV